MTARSSSGSGDIIQFVPSQRFSRPFSEDAARSLSRASNGESVALHVHSRGGRFLDRGGLAGSSRASDRRPAWRSGRSPERGNAARRRRRMSRWKRNCSPTKRNAPNTSCSWTSRATTSGASADFGSVQVPEMMVVERYSPRDAHRVAGRGQDCRRTRTPTT